MLLIKLKDKTMHRESTNGKPLKVQIFLPTFYGPQTKQHYELGQTPDKV